MTNKLVLVRHGESEWNKRNIFTGLRNPDLTDKGVIEARWAGRVLKDQGLHFDIAFTSMLKRAQHTLDIILGELGDDTEVHRSEAINERDYGELSGLNKEEARARWGEAKVLAWRRSFDIPPPGGESLKDTAARVQPTTWSTSGPTWPPARTSSSPPTATRCVRSSCISSVSPRIKSSTASLQPRRLRCTGSMRPARWPSIKNSYGPRGATVVWDELGRDAEDENRRYHDRLIAVYIGVLAVILAICSMGGGNAAKDATLKNIEVTNTLGLLPGQEPASPGYPPPHRRARDSSRHQSQHP